MRTHIYVYRHMYAHPYTYPHAYERNKCVHVFLKLMCHQITTKPSSNHHQAMEEGATL